MKRMLSRAMRRRSELRLYDSLLLASVLLLPCLPAAAQRRSGSPQPYDASAQIDASQGRIGRQRDRVQDQQAEQLEREQEKKRNKQRQEELQKDTDKLLDLATQLKQYVDKSNEHLLSIDVVRKAEEIEKLAHSVKEKMRSGL
jgi:hypothetical protein